MKNTFLENLRPASWRGVSFQVNSEESEFGRNAVVHEFVQRDKPYVEDLGRKTRKFKVEAWICASVDNGFNPWPQRDALIEAVEAGGPGTLVHPFYGTLTGHVLTAQVKQSSTQDGGLVVIVLEFVEAGEVEFRASAFANTQAIVNSSAEAVYESVEQEFAQTFDVDGYPSFVLNDAIDMVRQLRSGIALAGKIKTIAGQIAAGNLAAFASSGIYPGGAELARQVVGLIRDVERPGLLKSYSRQPVPNRALKTRSREQQQSNQDAFVQLVRVASATAAAQQSADLAANSPRFTADSVYLRDTPALITRDELQTMRRDVAVSLGDSLIELSELDVYPGTQQAVRQLRTDAVQHMTAEGENLASTFTTSCCNGTSWDCAMPTLVVAYRHYGVLSDDVINERNDIANPLFIAPRAPIELLV